MAEKEGERVYTIPFRKAYTKSMRIRSRYAMYIVRNFLKTHMKTDKVLIGKNLNEAVWERGMKKPPRRVKVSAVKEGNVVKVELFGHKYEEFKAVPKKERKGLKEKMLERLGPLATKKQEEEKMVEGKTEEKAEVKSEADKEVKTEVRTEISSTAPISEHKDVSGAKPKIAKGKKTKEAKKE